MGALHGRGHLSADPCSECVIRTGGGRIRQESWLLGSAGRSGHGQGSSASRTQADLGLSRAWETGAVSPFCASSLQRRRRYPQTGICQTTKSAGMSLVSSSYSPFSFSLCYLSPLPTFPSPILPLSPSLGTRQHCVSSRSSSTGAAGQAPVTLWKWTLLANQRSCGSKNWEQTPITPPLDGLHVILERQNVCQ